MLRTEVEHGEMARQTRVITGVKWHDPEFDVVALYFLLKMFQLVQHYFAVADDVAERGLADVGDEPRRIPAGDRVTSTDAKRDARGDLARWQALHHRSDVAAVLEQAGDQDRRDARDGLGVLFEVDQCREVLLTLGRGRQPATGLGACGESDDLLVAFPGDSEMGEDLGHDGVLRDLFSSLVLAESAVVEFEFAAEFAQAEA
ncbi:hypothetical protein SD37_11855 [Amycolatopsis orientalis]|uniref:Uncharacterized protein n=1 Tax=Amycolatopsis orientalis TaxID=31958 RepID=A0A193BVS7_AMYOR|nr:hypothetical protein SD37_11855 [Amycolatopsis orientalis]